MYNLTDRDYSILIEILDEFTSNCEVWVFGSRQKGCAKPYFDLDLVLFGTIEQEKEIQLREALMNSDMTIKVDLLNWNNLSESFKRVIEKEYSVIEKTLK